MLDVAFVFALAALKGGGVSGGPSGERVQRLWARAGSGRCAEASPSRRGATSSSGRAAAISRSVGSPTIAQNCSRDWLGSALEPAIEELRAGDGDAVCGDAVQRHRFALLLLVPDRHHVGLRRACGPCWSGCPSTRSPPRAGMPSACAARDRVHLIRCGIDERRDNHDVGPMRVEKCVSGLTGIAPRARVQPSIGAGELTLAQRADAIERRTATRQHLALHPRAQRRGIREPRMQIANEVERPAHGARQRRPHDRAASESRRACAIARRRRALRAARACARAANSRRR